MSYASRVKAGPTSSPGQNSQKEQRSFAAAVTGSTPSSPPAAPRPPSSLGLTGRLVRLFPLRPDMAPIYEGILARRSSPTADYSLYMVRSWMRASGPSPSPTTPYREGPVTVPMKSVAFVTCHWSSIEKSEAERSAFRTDTQISSRGQGTGGKGSKLQRWNDGDETMGMSLDAEARSQGGKVAWDQFAVNKEKFGYKSSYVEEDYTTPVDKTSEFYQRHEKRAAEVAREIQTGGTSNVHIAEERGQTTKESTLTEEERFSTVLPTSSSAYQIPARRAEAEEKKADQTEVETKSLNPEAKEFTFNPSASEFVMPSPTPMGDAPPMMMPFFPQGQPMMPMVDPQQGAYHNMMMVRGHYPAAQQGYGGMRYPPPNQGPN